MKMTEQLSSNFSSFIHSEPEFWHEDLEFFDPVDFNVLMTLIESNFVNVEAINEFKDIVATYYKPLKDFYKNKFPSSLRIGLTKPYYAPQMNPPVPEDIIGTEDHIGCFFILDFCDTELKYEDGLIVCLLMDSKTRQFLKAYTDPEPPNKKLN